MRRNLGQVLELAGLVVVALGFFRGVTTDNLGLELAMLAVGAALFGAGWAISGGSRRS